MRARLTELALLQLILLEPTYAMEAGEPQLAHWTVGGPDRSAFRVSLDESEYHSGSSSARLEARDFQVGKFVTLMQKVHAEPYRERSIRMTAWVKAKSVSGAHLWMRVDGESRYLAMDAMEDRRLDGSFEWQSIEIVLPVPNEAKVINLGVVLQSEGTMWVDDFSLTPVCDETTQTSTLVGTPEFENQIRARPIEQLPRELVNPGFETGSSKKALNR